MDYLSKIRHLFIIITVMNYKIYVKIRPKIDARGGPVAGCFNKSFLYNKIGIKITILHFI